MGKDLRRKKLRLKVLKGLVLLVCVSTILTIKLFLSTQDEKLSMDKLNVYVPFIFSNEFDPRRTFTVGDQMVSEHIFAYHFSASLDKVVLPLFSNVSIDNKSNTITFNLTKEISDYAGKKFDPQEICGSLKSSLSGTQHTNYSSFIESINCTENQIQIKMSTIPVNIEYWLRSTDFAIFRQENLPLNNSSTEGTTGPYFIEKFDTKNVHLKRNIFFPKEFVSNNIDNVFLINYSLDDISQNLKKTPYNDIWYLYGYAVNDKHIQLFKDKKYKAQIFPNEWLLYFGFQDTLSLDERVFISATIDKWRAEIKPQITYGQLAYSTVPKDRAYGLNEQEYTQSVPRSKINKLRTTIKVATLDEWATTPIFQFLISKLRNDLDIELKIFSRDKLRNIFSKDEADMYFGPVGISLADPIGNYSFLQSFNDLFQKHISTEDISSLYSEKSFEIFSQKVKKIELEILKNRMLLPLGHFPGIIMESPLLMRDEEKSWDWGIQAWTYKVI